MVSEIRFMAYLSACFHRNRRYNGDSTHFHQFNQISFEFQHQASVFHQVAMLYVTEITSILGHILEVSTAITVPENQCQVVGDYAQGQLS